MDHLLERFESLTRLLLRGRALWEPLPFKHLEIPWQEQHPNLASTLAKISDATLATLETDFRLLSNHLSPCIEDAGLLWERCHFPPPHSPQRGALGAPPPGVPGRKWDQICHFLSPLPEDQGLFTEWCSGKGHLARTFSSHSHQPVQCFDHDPHLCAAGTALATRAEVPVHFSCVDVLEGIELKKNDRVLALHACGDLHRELLSKAVSSSIEWLRYSPCCYHRTLADHYVPLSLAARSNPPLKLRASDLRLAVHETVTAPLHDRRRRVQNSTYRLGFDLLLRDLTGHDTYTPIPSFRNGELSLPFPQFCRRLAREQGLSLPPRLNLANYLQKGRRRHRQVTEQDLVRHLYRRPLETWLVLDGALFLAENGFEVQLDTFCPRNTSPRNLRVEAARITR